MLVDAPSGGLVGFESPWTALIGEYPPERAWLWQTLYRSLAYYGRQGAGLQMLSGANITLWDIASKALRQPVWKRLGARPRAGAGLRPDRGLRGLGRTGYGTVTPAF